MPKLIFLGTTGGEKQRNGEKDNFSTFNFLVSKDYFSFFIIKFQYCY